MIHVCLFVCVIQRGHLETAPHLLSHEKDVKLGKYTVSTGNRTPGRRVAVHYATAAPRKLPPSMMHHSFLDTPWFFDTLQFFLSVVVMWYKSFAR